MTDGEFETICRVLARQFTYPVEVTRALDRQLPRNPSWTQGVKSVWREERRALYGEPMESADELRGLLARGYYAVLQDQGLLLFSGRPGAGAYKYVADALAAEYAPRLDPHNWGVLQRRAAEVPGLVEAGDLTRAQHYVDELTQRFGPNHPLVIETATYLALAGE